MKKQHDVSAASVLEVHAFSCGAIDDFSYLLCNSALLMPRGRRMGWHPLVL